MQVLLNFSHKDNRTLAFTVEIEIKCEVIAHDFRSLIIESTHFGALVSYRADIGYDIKLWLFIRDHVPSVLVGRRIYPCVRDESYVVTIVALRNELDLKRVSIFADRANASLDLYFVDTWWEKTLVSRLKRVPTRHSIEITSFTDVSETVRTTYVQAFILRYAFDRLHDERIYPESEKTIISVLSVRLHSRLKS